MQIIGNKYTEKDLREHLSELGYCGRTARFLTLELKAIERPGWVQVFEFHIHAKKQHGDWEQHFGLCRSDERTDTFEVQLFSSQDGFLQAFRRESEDMISHERGPRHWSFGPLMAVFALAIITAIVGAIVTSAATSP